MKFYTTAVVITILCFGSYSSVMAKGSKANGPVKITNVQVQSDMGTIVILGENFDPDGPMTVVLGDTTLVGDISSYCMLDSLPTMIICDFSSSAFPDAGDYLLKVAFGNTGKGSKASKDKANTFDEYALTIGSLGSSCTLSQCVDELATLSCGSTAVQIPCVVAPASFPDSGLFAGVQCLRQPVAGQDPDPGVLFLSQLAVLRVETATVPAPIPNYTATAGCANRGTASFPNVGNQGTRVNLFVCPGGATGGGSCSAQNQLLPPSCQVGDTFEITIVVDADPLIGSATCRYEVVAGP